MWPFKKRVPLAEPAFPTVPAVLPDDPGGREELLRNLYTYVESLAGYYRAWYMQHRIFRQVISLWIRVASLILILLGTLCPLFPKGFKFKDHEIADWGYVLIAIGGGVLLFDRLFGLSSQWMRYISAAFEIETLLDAFRVRWMKIQVDAKDSQNEALPSADSPTTSQVLIALVEETVNKVHAIVVAEASAWSTELQSNLAYQMSLGKDRTDPLKVQVPSQPKKRS